MEDTELPAMTERLLTYIVYTLSLVIGRRPGFTGLVTMESRTDAGLPRRKTSRNKAMLGVLWERSLVAIR
ncbi:hypothetical protein NDU88_008210 [Pleurodeles waltl]|uniref:Uncharacterized protein n=1 Tax=Pleurodeles waltl TaxID=8319 RepID=A0AAV7QMV0_PLEWA|nr:hypothetical protein NDU88_008210 [Pleurodeles waltl]